jgi:hypothetical protein
VQLPHSCLLFKPISLVKVTAPRVETSAASYKTVKNRSKEIGSFRSQVIGGKGKQRQLVDEMKGLTDGEREELLGIFSTKVSVTADDALALKAGLMIPWTKLRAMRR